MREILFRGKRVDNGGWVEGYYAVKGKGTDLEKHFIVASTFDSNTNAYPFYFTDNWVESETICQYTGLTDKNGKKIFEGDIVQDAEWEFEEYEPEVKGIVRFMTGTFDSGVYEYNGWVVEEKDKNIDHTPLLQYKKRDKWGNVGFEIIGNIFDNPELTKE